MGYGGNKFSSGPVQVLQHLQLLYCIQLLLKV